MGRKKVCVFITGTNGVGKSSLARAAIKHFGGVKCEDGGVTYLRDGGVCLAGSYKVKFGGVDWLRGGKGSSTSVLASVVEEGLKTADIMICEGSFMNTFGLNLSNALFKAERHLVVNLYADPLVLHSRISARLGGDREAVAKRNWKQILSRQRDSMRAACKWRSIGVKVLQIDTSQASIEECFGQMLNAVNELCTQ